MIVAYAGFHQRRRRVQWVVAVLLLTWATLGTSPIVARHLTAALENQYALPASPARSPPDAALLIVLASGFTEPTSAGIRVRLDRAGWERTWGAVQAWRVVGGTLRFAGGGKGGGTQTVAGRMAEVAAALGVPRRHIEVEDRSHNTYENLAFSADRIRTHGDPVWVVTSAEHMPRAMAVATRMVLAIRAWPCDYRSTRDVGWRAIIPTAQAARANQLALHEFLGLWYYRLRGWA